MDTPKNSGAEDIAVKIFFIMTGLAGFFLIIFITSKWGIGVTTDSAGYLAGARNIVDGKGISLLSDSMGNPLIVWPPWRDNETLHIFPWPPFLPLVLSIFGFMKLNLVEAGRFLNAALFGANIFLVAFIAKKYLKSVFLMVFSAIILITSEDMLKIHFNLWSEPLFIFLGLMGFVFLFYFIEKKKIHYLLISSLFFGLALFTRTIGISLVAVCAVAVLLYSGLKVKKRIIYTIFSVLIGILPFSIWTLVNNIIYGNSVEVIFHPFKIKYYTRILSTIALWVMPDKTPEKARVILISIIIAAIISAAVYMAIKNRRRTVDESYKLNSKIIGIFLFHILFYFVALMIARYFFDVSLVPDLDRILLPVLISIFIVFLFFLKRLLDFYSGKEYIKIIVYVFCGFLIATSLFNSNAIRLYNGGGGYNSKSWYQSETIKELKEFQQTKNPIYTNEPAVVYLFLGKSSILLPEKQNMRTGKINPDYQKDLYRTMEEIKEKDGILVFFDRGWGVFPEEQEINLDYEFYLYKDTADGAIYRIKN